MKAIISLLLLTAIAAGCSNQRTVVLTYQDNVQDTIQTSHHYKYNQVVYVNECSCDATVSKP